jgi:hypothetical protein
LRTRPLTEEQEITRVSVSKNQAPTNGSDDVVLFDCANIEITKVHGIIAIYVISLDIALPLGASARVRCAQRSSTSHTAGFSSSNGPKRRPHIDNRRLHKLPGTAFTGKRCVLGDITPVNLRSRSSRIAPQMTTSRNPRADRFRLYVSCTHRQFVFV